MKFGTIKYINKILSYISPFQLKTQSKHDMYCSKIDYKNLASIYGEESLKKKNFLNFGAGYRFKHFAFKNVDNFKGDIDLKWSPCEMKPIDIKDQSIKVIYTSHMIEHLTFEEAVFMLKEFFRILEPNGQLRIVTPDIDIFHEAYLKKDTTMFDSRFSIDQAYVATFAARLIIGFNEFKPSISTEEINALFKSKDRFDFYDYLINKVDATKDRKDWYNHISWWNYNRLEKILKESGFSSIYKSAYSQSKFLILRDIKHFDQTAPWYSVYVDAIK